MNNRLLFVPAGTLLAVLGCSHQDVGLVFSEPAVEIPDVTGSLSHSFQFVNRTDAPVKILKMQGSCNCMRVSCREKVVDPGESC